MWRNRSPQRLTAIELIDELFSDASVPPCRVAHGRLLDVARRQPVPRLAGHRSLPHLPLRGGGARSSTPTTRRSRAATTAPSPASRAAATARWSRRCSAPTCSARWRRTPATRSSSSATGATCPRWCARCAQRYDGSYARFFDDLRGRLPRTSKEDGMLSNMWAMAAAYSADADGTVELPFDTVDRADDPRGVGALAGVGPGAHGAAPRRRAAVAGGRSTSTPGRSDEFFLDLGAVAFRDALTRGRVSPTCSSSSSTRATCPSSTATRWRCATWRSASARRPERQRRPRARTPAVCAARRGARRRPGTRTTTGVTSASGRRRLLRRGHRAAAVVGAVVPVALVGAGGGEVEGRQRAEEQREDERHRQGQRQVDLPLHADEREDHEGDHEGGGRHDPHPQRAALTVRTELALEGSQRRRQPAERGHAVGRSTPPSYARVRRRSPVRWQSSVHR